MASWQVFLGGAGLAVAGLLAWRYFGRRDAHEVYLQDIDGVIDGAGPDSGAKVTAFQMRYTMRTKAEFGELSDTSANRKIVSEYLRKVMHDEDVRYVDIARNLPCIIELVMLPTIATVRAREMAQSKAFRERKKVVGQTHW